MPGALLFALALAIVARAWRSGRAADPARVPALLLRLPLAAAAAVVLLPLASRAAGAAMAALTVACGLAALVAFDALVSLALWGPFRRRGIALRAPFAVAAALVAAFHGPWTAVTMLGAVALVSFRWRAALATGALFRCALGAAALVAFMVLYPDRPGGAGEGPLAPLTTFARIVVGLVRIYAVLAVLKTFIAFTRDPSLGIRRVTRRLALSHVLVLVVPLAITVTLWVATTFLGVNADRALAARQSLEQEGARIAADLRAGLRADDRGRALVRIAEERARRWPGSRLWFDGGDGLARVVGDSVAGEVRLADWLAALDSLPAHGMVGLGGARWLGAAVDGAAGGRAVMLVPVQSVLDSSVAPILPARYTMAIGDAPVALIPADSVRSPADTMPATRRAVDALRAGSAAERRAARRGRGPRVSVTDRARPAPLVVDVGSGPDTIRTTESLASSGIANVPGIEHQRGRWRRSEFLLAARVDGRATLIGLFANLGRNQLQIVPVVMLGMVALLLLPVAWLDFSMVGGMGRSIARAVDAMRRGATALGGGDLSHRIEIQGEDDLWETARQFNRMAEGLERARAIEKERDRLEGELELARRIQQRLLPGAPPAVAGLEIAGRYEPAREVGGDYYDHLDLGGGRVLLVIADVSGKGVPAALLMSGFRASLMSQDAGALGPDRLAERVNEFLHRSVETGKFVTAFLAFLDAASGRLVYANAGHNPPALLRADGRVEWLSAGGLVLGILPHSRFESGEATLAPGDLLALYTDGVTEGANAAGELWGDERLVAALQRLRGRPCAEAAAALVREVRAFEGEAGAADDITVLLARRV